MFRAVDRSPGLHQGLRSRVSVGTLSRDQTSTVSDDWLILASSEREAKQAVQSLLSLCRTLGIVINEKSDLVPSQTAKYLGMTIDTEAGKVFPSGASREIPDGSGDLLCHGRSPGSALAGDPRSPGFARAAGYSRSPSDAFSAVAS